MAQFEVIVDPEREAWLGRMLTESNTAVSPNLAALRGTSAENEEPLQIYVRDDDGDLVGGLTGYTWAYWLHVHLLWVDARLRGAGLGSELLGRAEKIASTERECRHVRLETWDFQAPDFYRGHGYELAGTVRDYPPGSVEYIFVKRLG
ncbi:GNAT family N-acetyltransferase [Embleya sp. NPDC056575]|uniref:GNAT family N-acetyltransferase n=1 Tax=unclassified Embleya TaxID=2699296 RepID=UPI00369384B8